MSSIPATRPANAERMLNLADICGALLPPQPNVAPPLQTMKSTLLRLLLSLAGCFVCDPERIDSLYYDRNGIAT